MTATRPAPLPAGVASRVIASRVLDAVLHRGHSLKAELASSLPTLPDVRDRALVEAICFAVVRQPARYAAAIDGWTARPLGRRDAPLRALLYVGLAQLDPLGLPAHAAVDATVEATRAIKRPHQAGLVNALLRRALRDAGIEKCNLVYVSSIFPPNCKVLTKEKGVEYLKAGQITFCVMARNETNEPNRLVSAAVGVAVPTNKDSQHGYLSEHHPFGEKADKAGEYAEDLAATMLATTLGIEFDPNVAWDEREQQYKASGKIFKTFNTTQSAEGNKDGLWTSVVAVAVFIVEYE